MNKKGFTLTEIIAVIVVLSIIFLFVIPPVTKIINNSKETAYENQVQNIIGAAKNWSVKNPGLLPKNGESITIFLGELKSSGAIKLELKNPMTKKLLSNNTSIVITNDDGNYKYEVNIVDIEVTEDENSPILIIGGNIVDYVEVNQEGILYTIPSATAKTSIGESIPESYISYQILKDNSEVSSVDTSTLGTYVINYSVTYNGKKGNYQKTVIVRDTTAPIITIGSNLSVSTNFEDVDLMEGVTITDNSGEVIEPIIKSTISSIEGTHYVYYTAKDSSGNETTKRREVTVYSE